jgi:hypothetical protein
VLRNRGPSAPTSRYSSRLPPASTVRLLSFDAAAGWAQIIENETNADVAFIRLGRFPVDPDLARRSADIVARTVAQSRLASLDNHALMELQDWRNEDEKIVADLRAVLKTTEPLSASLDKGRTYAAHVVAAAVVEGLAAGTKIPPLFDRMINLLKLMHDTNPSWGPLYIAHPEDRSASKFH